MTFEPSASQAQIDARLIGGQADAVGGVHGLVHVGDQLRQLRHVAGDGAGRIVQDGIAADDDGQDGHGEILRGGFRTPGRPVL